MIKLTDILREVRGNIADVILQVRDEFKDDWGGDYCKINTGGCEDFADTVHAKMGRPSNMIIMDDGIFWQESAATPSDQWDNNGSEPYNMSALERYGSELDKIPEGFQMVGHVWIYYNGKHYDAETPYGTSSIWDMPIFKRNLESYR